MTVKAEEDVSFRMYTNVASNPQPDGETAPRHELPTEEMSIELTSLIALSVGASGANPHTGGT